MSLADIIMWSLLVGGVAALCTIVWTYAKGLRQSPYDMWLLFGYKILEYSGYGAMVLTLSLWLSADCGLSDIHAGWFLTAWSVVLTSMGMIAGSLVDVAGIRKIQIFSICFLIFARLMFAFVTNPYLAFVLAFLPMGIGFGVVASLISVAIKRYTTKEGAALGFGLFYVLMNVGYAIGGWFFDWSRTFFAARDAAGNILRTATGKVVNENAGTVLLGHHFSTYQLIFLFGFTLTCISLLISFFMRDGVEMQADGTITIAPPTPSKPWLDTVVDTVRSTGSMIAKAATHRYFWIFMGMLTTTLFVRAVFLHFHYTFPKYGIRVLGEGAKTGSIYGVLNPVLIVFLVPLVAYFTKRVSSYRMMLVGATVSSLACFIAVIPSSFFAGLTNTVAGELIFVKLLRMTPDMATLMQNPPSASYWPLIFMIAVFTLGEAIWSPRLMQFTAEIAPKGQEGTYIALSALPFFVPKFFVGPMSGWLLTTYTPVDAAGKALAYYPHHQFIWLWIGGMAVLTPLGLLLFRHWFVGGPKMAEPSLTEGEVKVGEEAEGRS